MDGRKRNLIAVIVIGVLLWGFYIIQEEFANYGMYQLISYRTHEFASIIPLLCFVVSVCCVVYLVVRIFKRKSDTTEKILLIVFVLCFVMQFLYFESRSDLVHTDAVCTIEEIYEREGTISVSIGDGDSKITLKCPMLVRGLLVKNEQQYLISFVYHTSHPSEGELHMISLVD